MLVDDKATKLVNVCNRLIGRQSYDKALQGIQLGLKAYPERGEFRDLWLMFDPLWKTSLQGNNILLNQRELSDVDNLLQWLSVKEFMGLFQPLAAATPEREGLESLIRNQKMSVVKSRAIHWVIRQRKGEVFYPVGLASLVDIRFQSRKAEFILGIPNKCLHGSSVGLESTLLILDFVFNHIGLIKLTSVVVAHNDLAQKSTLSVGFTQEGFLKKHLRNSRTGQCYDAYLNGIIVDDFRQNRRLSRVSKRLLGRDITVPLSASLD
jgi:diamine N-acetyltransferase